MDHGAERERVGRIGAACGTDYLAAHGDSQYSSSTAPAEIEVNEG